MTKDTFAKILQAVEEKYSPHYSGGFLPITAKTSLQIGLWYLGNKATYREIAEQFGLSEATVFNCVQRIIEILVGMAPDNIKWPTGSGVGETVAAFKEIAGFPGVVGAIDGCHIEIKAPDSTQSDFIDRTLRHSVNLLAVCDAEKRFTYIYPGFPGSGHDSRVFRVSGLHQRMNAAPQSLFPSTMYHIVGDSAFQLTTYVMVPYKDYGHLTQRQRRYNTVLSKTRCVIENAFGWLKGRFRRLKYIDAELSRIPDIITACCVLHNITLNNTIEEIYISNEVELPAVCEGDIFREDVNLPDLSGREKREFLSSLL